MNHRPFFRLQQRIRFPVIDIEKAAVPSSGQEKVTTPEEPYLDVVAFTEYGEYI